MDVLHHWNAIRKIVNRALKKNGSCAVATINPDGSPRVSPIGSLILGEGAKGFYFDRFTQGMRQNLERDQRVCILAVSNGFWYMLNALFKGRFDTPPGVRLIGRVGPMREATAEEVEHWGRRVKAFRRLKGYELLWKDMRYVRDITFDGFEPIHLGKMGEGLWKENGQMPQ